MDRYTSLSLSLFFLSFFLVVFFFFFPSFSRQLFLRSPLFFSLWRSWGSEVDSLLQFSFFLYISTGGSHSTKKERKKWRSFELLLSSSCFFFLFISLEFCTLHQSHLYPPPPPPPFPHHVRRRRRNLVVFFSFFREGERWSRWWQPEIWEDFFSTKRWRRGLEKQDEFIIIFFSFFFSLFFFFYSSSAAGGEDECVEFIWRSLLLLLVFFFFFFSVKCRCYAPAPPLPLRCLLFRLMRATPLLRL